MEPFLWSFQARASAGAALRDRRRLQRRTFSDRDSERRSFEQRERRLDAWADTERERDRADAERAAENDAVRLFQFVSRRLLRVTRRRSGHRRRGGSRR